jgi:hypothetical protein
MKIEIKSGDESIFQAECAKIARLGRWIAIIKPNKKTYIKKSVVVHVVDKNTSKKFQSEEIKSSKNHICFKYSSCISMIEDV